MTKTINRTAVDELKAACPEMFKKGIRPFKVGISLDLIASGIPPEVVMRAMADLTNTKQYAEACRCGQPRFDMRGERSGVVTYAEHRNAQDRLKTIALLESNDRLDQALRALLSRGGAKNVLA